MIKKTCYLPVLILLLVTGCETSGSIQKKTIETFEGNLTVESLLLYKSQSNNDRSDRLILTKRSINNDTTYSLTYIINDRAWHNATTFRLKIDDTLYSLTDKNPARSSSVRAQNNTILWSNSFATSYATSTNLTTETLTFVVSPSMLEELKGAASIMFESNIRTELSFISQQNLIKLKKFL